MNTFFSVYANPTYALKKKLNQMINRNRGKKTYLRMAMITVDKQDKH